MFASGSQNDLVVRCQQGDNKAFHDLYLRHRADVARLVHRMLGPVPEVDDVIQDVFFQVYRSIGDFRGSARFSTWLHRVAINVVLMHLRAQRSRPNLSDPLSHDLKAVGPSPDEETMRRERIRTFYGVLDRLSEKKRIVFVLHEIEGLSPRAIADIVGAPALTVRTRLHYARRELISLLRNEPSLAALADVMVRPGSTDVTATCEAQST